MAELRAWGTAASRSARGPLAGVAVAVAVAVGLAASAGQAQTMGGDVIVAQNSNPPSLDAMVTTSQASRNINMNFYEKLFAYDERLEPIPDLAAGLEISDDGRVYTIPLREGVLFHDGTEMTSEDVVASLERYRRVGGSADTLANVASIEATGPYQVTITLEEPQPPFLRMLASPRAPAVIIPATDADAPANETSLIGTGPYRFIEFVPDSHVRLERFEDYVPNAADDSRRGFGGHKVPYFDSVTFRVIVDPGARTAALEAGEIHVNESVPVPSARRLAGDPEIEVYELLPWAFLTTWFNWNEPPTDHPKVREAIQIALDMEEVMAIATEGLYQMDHAWQHPGTRFHSEVGAELYNIADVERAKELLAEAGYDDTELVILTDSNYAEHNKAAVVVAEQLRAIGMNVRVHQVDWPTALQIRLQDDGWNMWTLLMGIEPYLGPYAMAAVFVGDQPFMRARDERLEETFRRLTSSPDPDEQVQAFADFQERIYETFPAVKLGAIGITQASRANVRGFEPFRFPRMYGVWLE